VARDFALELLRRDVSPGEYDEIRELWKRHSLAEEARDIERILSTLTEDCVYEISGIGHVWRGLAGAASFYRELLTAFPDVDFALTDIVIGPQGVCEEATVTGTHVGDWLGFVATGRRIEETVVIFFPWDLGKRRFKGEKIHFDPARVVGA